MLVLRTVLVVIQIIVMVGLIISVLMQQGNAQGMGAISGGADTFFGKNKARTIDGIFKTITKILAVLFIVLSLALTFLYK